MCFTFILIGFAALGEARTTRQGRGFAIAAAVIAVMGVRIAGFAMSSAMVRSAAFVPLAYLLPAAVSAFCLVMIFAGHRLEPLRVRALQMQDRLVELARPRKARAA